MGNTNSTSTSRELQETPVNMHVLRSEILRLGQDGREMEVCVPHDHLETSLALLNERCTKNPGHKDFIACNELRLEDLPVDSRYPAVLGVVNHAAMSTVKLTVSYTSPGRPDRFGSANLKGTDTERLGTGWFYLKVIGNCDQKCPLEICLNKENHSSSPYFVIRTAAHVVWDNAEAVKTKVQFNYMDDDDQNNVIDAYGAYVESVNAEDDTCDLVCVTHTFGLLEFFKTKEIENLLLFTGVKDLSLSFIVSHPHGLGKHISFGAVHDIKYKGEYPLTEKDIQVIEEGKKRTGKSVLPIKCVLEYTIPTCPGSSGAPVFFYKLRNGQIQNITVSVHSQRHPELTNINVSGMGIETIYEICDVRS